MAANEMVADRGLRAVGMTERVPNFIRAVYGWMAGGLALTAATAALVAASPGFANAIETNTVMFWGLAVAQIGIVVVLSARVDRLAAATAASLFVVYSALTGVTLSFVLLAYTGESAAATFLVTAGMFGAMAAFGATTKRSFAGVGQFLVMGLIGVVLASVVGVFWHNDALQFLISLVGVIVFAGLAAFDAQRLASMAEGVPAGAYAVSGALALYLDFVNLFLSLLRFGGRRRE